MAWDRPGANASGDDGRPGGTGRDDGGTAGPGAPEDGASGDGGGTPQGDGRGAFEDGTSGTGDAARAASAGGTFGAPGSGTPSGTPGSGTPGGGAFGAPGTRAFGTSTTGTGGSVGFGSGGFGPPPHAGFGPPPQNGYGDDLFHIPPQPSQPPTIAPPEPPPPPGPAEPLRAVAVALLNLSGLGLGYALLRRRLATAVCWIATAALLLTALPAKPEGVDTAVLAGYAAVLLLAAAHGAARGLRTPLAWPPRTPVAALLGLVLLAIPVGGVHLYDGARDEATEQALLDRLDKADHLVLAAGDEPFSTARPRYQDALATYHDLTAHHSGSRAAKKVPDRLKTYYTTIGAPYEEKKYCDAVPPLEYLRTVPDTMDGKAVGSLATWPDDRLATSLYECGVDDLGVDKDADTKGGDLAELLTTFPDSDQAAKVEPAVSASIADAAKGIKGDDPCAANEKLRTLRSQATDLPGEKAGVADALDKDAADVGKHLRAGLYACGVDQYKDKDFESSLSTLNDFVRTYKDDKNVPRAKKIAIAAEIAQTTPDAGRHLPTSASGGSVSVTISNDSPDEIEVLYTGPVTGRLTLKACGGCSTYLSDASASLSACKDSGKNYPSKTVHLPVGTTYFLHKPTDGTTSVGTDTAELEPGYTYTECAYVVESLGAGYDS